MVRLLQGKGRWIALTAFRFNPTMVRLLLALNWKRGWANGGFNPTMVRLLRDKPSKNCNEIKFQSHNGAIAATLA